MTSTWNWTYDDTALVYCPDYQTCIQVGSGRRAS